MSQTFRTGWATTGKGFKYHLYDSTGNSACNYLKKPRELLYAEGDEPPAGACTACYRIHQMNLKAAADAQKRAEAAKRQQAIQAAAAAQTSLF